jgi:hypothetical protein
LLLLVALVLLLPHLAHAQACRAMRECAAARGVKLLLPRDIVVARSLDDDHGCCTVPLTVSCCTPEAPCVPNGGLLLTGRLHFASRRFDNVMNPTMMNPTMT